ncbi:response regulator transcription factor [Aurantiacibacter marinus]|uniref:Response regulator FixJ n=1 Tax=Aurantiacibacter marinus TaxID=874156 RepID=A0A0H0XRM5_9SPHN|nr:response regulator transcription factor [Aurantiacibacter marinus]KLI62910.1 response regulator FixJ [Aurantiacibacter marinus]
MAECTIYLVDDDDSVRRSVGFMLKTSGYKVDTFASGDEFLAAASRLEPGCILLDVRMPGTDGIEVQTELKKLGITSPVTIMTGHGDIGMAVTAMKAGACDFIEKPFEKHTLIQALEHAEERLNDDDRRHKRRDDAIVLLNGLTPREHEVLEGLVKGYPNKTIGYDLGISPRTVEIHRAHLMQKVGVHSLSDLLRIAFRAGLGENDRTSAD